MSAILPALLAGLIGFLITEYRSRRPLHPPADKWVREKFVPVAYGLVPREALDASRAGPPAPPYRLKEMQAVAQAAWAGDWRPAAAYVAAAGDDWDSRWSRTEVLQQIADEDDAWLEAWRSEQPDNCDAATVHAGLLLHRAWEIRGVEYAPMVPAERMQQFQALLPQAMNAAHAAAELDPRNPGPWVVMITAARAMSYSHKQFRGLWEGLTARAPHHYMGHCQALQYWCGKWHGSDRRMLAFARRAVGNAPAGSPLAGMFLHALQELDTRGGTGREQARKSRRTLARITQSLAQVDPDDENLPQLRHLLAYYLLQARRHEAALEQFRLIGRWCGAFPWTESDDPVAAFDNARGRAAKRTKPQDHHKGAAAMRR
ncbi:hypothetical protein [Streptomyces tritici]|uniref:hypothetical protein n=1 Tax=Streptomyces tritici TaxID=2054410 RepID=UPI003AF13C48